MWYGFKRNSTCLWQHLGPATSAHLDLLVNIFRPYLSLKVAATQFYRWVPRTELLGYSWWSYISRFISLSKIEFTFLKRNQLLEHTCLKCIVISFWYSKTDIKIDKIIHFKWMCSKATIMNGYVLDAILLTPILNYECILLLLN